MTYGYFTAILRLTFQLNGRDIRSLYPAIAGLRFRRSPERTFVSSGGRLRRFGAAQCPSSEPTGSDTACLFCGTWKTKFNQ